MQNINDTRNTSNERTPKNNFDYCFILIVALASILLTTYYIDKSNSKIRTDLIYFNNLNYGNFKYIEQHLNNLHNELIIKINNKTDILRYDIEIILNETSLNDSI